jgi:ribonuclease HI
MEMHPGYELSDTGYVYIASRRVGGGRMTYGLYVRDDERLLGVGYRPTTKTTELGAEIDATMAALLFCGELAMDGAVVLSQSRYLLEAAARLRCNRGWRDWSWVEPYPDTELELLETVIERFERFTIGGVRFQRPRQGDPGCRRAYSLAAKAMIPWHDETPHGKPSNNGRVAD